MTKIALLIGVSDYQAGLSALPAALQDVQAMHRVLADSTMGGFDDVKVLTNPDPQLLRYEIETVFSNLGREDLMLLYFSGHGIKDDSGRLYFATPATLKNANNELIRSTAVAASFVHDVMNNSRARRQAIILDCCFSGAFDPSLVPRDDSSVDLRSQLGAEGRVVLTSSSSTQYSYEQQGQDLSIYTRYVVEGIETGAGDLNEDGQVSAVELHEYATKKVREAAPSMTPKIIVLKDEGFDLILARARTTDPLLIYRRQAQKHTSRGEISPVGRMILQTSQAELGITPGQAIAIENEVLQPYHQRLHNLQRYQEALVKAMMQEYPLAEDIRDELVTLQEMLGLRDEDVQPIQEKVTAQLVQKAESAEPVAANLTSKAAVPASTEATELSTFPPSLPAEAEVSEVLTGRGNGQSAVVAPATSRAPSKHRPLLIALIGMVLLAVGSGIAAYFTYTTWQSRQQAQLLLNQAKEAADKTDYDACIEAAKQIPQKSQFFSPAQQVLSNCSGQKILASAQQLADKGSLSGAIAEASKISEDNPVYPEAQQLIERHVGNLLSVAEQYYQKGNLDNAKDAAQAIPENHSAYQQAEELVAKWEKNQNLLNAAMKALDEGKWIEARDTAKLIVHDEFAYWKTKTDNIANRAQAELNEIWRREQAKQKQEEAKQKQEETRKRCQTLKEGYKQGFIDVVAKVGAKGGPIREECKQVGITIPDEY